ncbi:hypothetical protein J5N97_004703 [Dioscorea zingiberensis]|uniref:Protein BZR1 homolog n=1 Tax=Dioscorea zingiberensis TaxID=325984 RepID=A0A9D5D8E5_9LILI|nr:hypothetical protein J5N97_004703 [Dioscorea zingiberensis]
MTSGTRAPTWKERENNKRRERRRRAIAAKIYKGFADVQELQAPQALRQQRGPQSCSAPRPVGPSRRTGSKPAGHMEIVGGSASPSPCSSYQPSPCASYNPSPASSSFASPASSSYITNANTNTNVTDGNSLIPWLKNLASASSATSKHPNHHPFLIHVGSRSAPVTPPLSSPTASTPRMTTDWDDTSAHRHGELLQAIHSCHLRLHRALVAKSFLILHGSQDFQIPTGAPHHPHSASSPPTHLPSSRKQ